MTDDPQSNSSAFDERLSKIASPLASNETFRELLAEFEVERARASERFDAGEQHPWEQLGDMEDALGKYLQLKSYEGEFERWDFEAAYFNDPRVRQLFDSNLEWMMEEWRLDDLPEMLEALDEAQASPPAYSRNELRNLHELLKRIEDPRAEDAAATLEALLAKR